MTMEEHVDFLRSPFYAWLDNQRIRELLAGASELPLGERFVLMKALIPGLVADAGLTAVEQLTVELLIKAQRYAEAQAHPGQGGATREIPGEVIGGPTPSGEELIGGPRDPRRPGGRHEEREWERAAWSEANAQAVARLRQLGQLSNVTLPEARS
jgi:hypothetical protein